MKIRIPLFRCPECGEPLFDGDTAYRIGDRLYCCACVQGGLTVCRRPSRKAEPTGKAGRNHAGKN